MARTWTIPSAVVAVDEGPLDGPTVVLLASLGTTLTVHDDLTTRLVEAGHRVLRVDLRGHGRSARSTVVETIDDLADDVRAVLDAAGVERATVMGCSVGAMAAARFAALHPQRTAALILTGAAASFGPPEMWLQRIDTVGREGMAALAGPSIERWVTERTRVALAAEVATIGRDLASLPPETFVAYARMMTTADVGPDLVDITAPTLVIVGSDDPSSPVAAAEHLADTIAGAQLRVVAGAKHLVHLDQPQILFDLVAGFVSLQPLS